MSDNVTFRQGELLALIASFVRYRLTSGLQPNRNNATETQYHYFSFGMPKILRIEGIFACRSTPREPLELLRLLSYWSSLRSLEFWWLCFCRRCSLPAKRLAACPAKIT